MSYLDLPRLYFFGNFFTDPSTINNESGNYDPSVVYQDTDQNAPGYVSWNPDGSAFFRFMNCKITGAVGADGAVLAGGGDPILGAAVETPQNPQTRVAKIVDLDTDQQGITQLVGVVVSITMPGGGSVSGSMAVAELRDLWLHRALGGNGDGFASGLWQSVLTDLKWSGEAASPLLKQLHAASPDLLSIKFVTDTFNDDSTSPTFCQGRLAGIIGPAGADEPSQIVMGRRLLPQDNSNCWPAPFQLAGGRLTIDLGNSLQLGSPGGPPAVQSPVRAAIIGPQGPVVLPTDLEVTGASYSANAWVFDVPLTADQATLAASNPVAIQTGDGSNTVLLAEASDGRYVNNEPLSLRLNPGESGTATLYGTQFGAPLANLALPFGLDPASSSNNTPPGAVQFGPQVKLDASGKGTVRITASRPDPLPSERAFIGSQVYFLGGDWENWGQIGQAGMAGAALTVLVFDTGDPVASPTWGANVGPVLTQYARLYPGMKARLDLSDYDAVKQGRDAVLKLIDLPFGDPAAMPVTRDLSAYHRKMIETWIKNGCPA